MRDYFEQHHLQFLREFVSQDVKMSIESERGKMKKEITPEEIIDIACETLQVDKDELFGECNKRDFADARSIVIMEIVINTNLIQEEIAVHVHRSRENITPSVKKYLRLRYEAKDCNYRKKAEKMEMAITAFRNKLFD